MKKFPQIIFPFLVFLFYSCSSTLTNLHFVKEEIADFYESGRYEDEVNRITTAAIKDFELVEAGDSSAIIFDVDETALSNYEVMEEISFGYVPEIWDKWIKEARAPAIKEVKNLYEFLIEKGFRIIFLTGRKDYHYEATIKNLQSAGYPTFDTLIVRMKDEYELNAVDFKTKKREELNLQGYKIIGTVGDQWSDLDGSFHGIQVKIPNYIYYIE